MCPECHRFICEESCPAYNGRSAERGRAFLFCSLCAAPIRRGEAFYSIGVRPFCAECLEGAESDELMKLFKYKTREDLLCSLGAVARTICDRKENS